MNRPPPNKAKLVVKSGALNSFNRTAGGMTIVFNGQTSAHDYVGMRKMATAASKAQTGMLTTYSKSKVHGTECHSF